MAEAAAIDFDGGIAAAEDGDVLIHDAARHADEIAFGALAEAGKVEGVDGAAAQKGQCGGDFERGGRTEPRAFRHAAADEQVGGREGEAGTSEFDSDADRVIGPMVSRLAQRDSGSAEFAQFAALLRVDAQHAIGRRNGGDVSGQIEGHRQDET